MEEVDFLLINWLNCMAIQTLKNALNATNNIFVIFEQEQLNLKILTKLLENVMMKILKG